MPLARIDIHKSASDALVRIVSDTIYKAMVENANVPPDDKFQIITRHADDEIIYPKAGYLGVSYTRGLIMIQITWVVGRSTDVKKRLFHQIADEIHTLGGVRKEDVWITLVENAREDWSFGGGVMQYGPK